MRTSPSNACFASAVIAPATSVTVDIKVPATPMIPVILLAIVPNTAAAPLPPVPAALDNILRAELAPFAEPPTPPPAPPPLPPAAAILPKAAP